VNKTDRPLYLGYTGPEHGMTHNQLFQVSSQMLTIHEEALTHFNGQIQAHHGGCVGGDFQFDMLCVYLDLDITVHPATDVARHKRAQFDLSYHQRTFSIGASALARNRGMAKWCDTLIATPAEYVEQQRSGVWATIRYYEKEGKVVILVYPGGDVEIRR